jgi:TonB-dependent starch-binding outer membrane protein SusC
MNKLCTIWGLDREKPIKFFKIMRISLFLILAGVMQVFATGTFSQNAKVSLNLKNATVRQVLEEIESQSGFYFIYSNKLVDVNRKMDIEAAAKPVSEVLNTVFKGTGIKSTVLQKQIVLSPETLLAKEIAQRSIKGQVTDGKDGSTIIGASVRIKGTTDGTITDIDGNFILKCKEGDVLIISFVGYTPQEIVVGTEDNIKVVMAADVHQVDEVVVVGYGQSSRKKLASSINSVGTEELNRGSISDVGQLLQGKVPGLNISSNGDPNQQAAIVLRGASTLNSSQSPFYVIDGIPGASIANVAPDDIATIDVLKDGAATSIYGNRAANGVIMITTKKGKKGQMVVSYNGYVGYEKVSNKLDMMNANQLRSFLETNSRSFLPADDLNANTDWQSAVQRESALSSNHNLSFSGGTEHNSYSASINYINKEGIMLKSKQSSLIARLNVEQSALNDKVRFGLNVSNARITLNNVPQRNVVLLQSVNHLPVSPVYNANGSYFENMNTSQYFNPLAIINEAKDDTKYNNLIAGFTTKVKLPFGLTYDVSLSYQNYTSLHGEYYGKYYTKYNTGNFYSNPEPPANKYIINFGINGLAIRNSYQTSNTIAETFFTWDKKFGAHSLNAVVGYSWQSNKYGDGFQSTNTNFPVDNIGYNNLALGNYQATSYQVNFGDANAYQETKLISDFGRLNYNYAEKYFLQASLRYDGASTFGKNNQWGLFPSVGSAWRITEESFMKGQEIFNDLKLRASYGVTGNSSGFNAFTAQFISGSQGTFYYNGVQAGAYGPVQAANPDLKWEKTATSNIGLDYSILKGKISGTIDVYSKTTTDMIYGYSVDPIIVPAGWINANGGEISNKGIEFTITATLMQKNGFSWNSTVNLAHNKNEIVSLSNSKFAGGDSTLITQPDGGGQTGSKLQILKAGKPLGQFFTLEYAGKNAQGVSQYYDKNGNLTTNPAIGVDYHYAGSPQPKLIYGWTNDFKYKNFDLNIFIRGVYGNKIFNATRADLFRPSTAQTNNILVDAGGESINDVNSYKYSSRFIEDGSYIRLDNATLGYTFPSFSKNIKKLRLYVTANNLFVITKYTGVDPEVNQGGIAPGVDYNNFYPKTRTILFGVNLSF